MYLEGAKLALYCFSLANDDLQESLSGKKQVLRGELWSLKIISLITLLLFSTWYSSIVVLLGCCLACAAPRYHPRFHTWPSRTRPTAWSASSSFSSPETTFYVLAHHPQRWKYCSLTLHARLDEALLLTLLRMNWTSWASGPHACQIFNRHDSRFSGRSTCKRTYL